MNNSIHTDFFKGRDSYVSPDTFKGAKRVRIPGKLERNRLRYDYSKWLYENGLDRAFDVAELEKAAKNADNY